ncbi:hypothetical protein [Myxosarcina sp. GI1(2024)]
MDKTVELPSGKIIDLSRFVALIPNEKAENQEYSLILEGYERSIALDLQEATSIKELLKADSSKNHNGVWDREEQLRKNQPAIGLLKKRIARNRLMSEAESKQREQFFTDFKKTVDQQRVSERKLYIPE